MLGEFLKEPFNKYLFIILLVLGAALLLSEYGISTTQGDTDAALTIHFFYAQGCHFCAAQHAFNTQLEEEFPEIIIVSHDIGIPEETRLLQIMLQNQSIGAYGVIGVPVTFVGNTMFVGFDNETKAQTIRQAVIDELAGKEVSGEVIFDNSQVLSHFKVPFIGIVDISAYSLPALAAVLGLVDGFNPCAMWVLVYLISLVMGLQDKKRVWLIVGTFVFASGVLYFLFMTAWLNAFLFFGYVRAITIIVGLVGLGGGILSIKEYMETKGEMTCKITDSKGKKKIMDQAKKLVIAPLTIATFVGIVVLAFVVNSVEFLCSAAIPAIFTQVLALKNLAWWEYYGYILLYDFFFMLDDLLIFGLAAFTFSGATGQQYAKYCKIIGGVILLVLGLMLLFAPGMLQ